MNKKQKEAERHRNLRLKKKKELHKCRALVEFLTKEDLELLKKFERQYESTPSPQLAPEKNPLPPPQVVSVPSQDMPPQSIVSVKFCLLLRSVR